MFDLRKPTVEAQILNPMQLVREFCTIGHRIRREHDIPVSYPLHEAEINAVALAPGFTLLQDEYQLIADELNVDSINPFLTDEQMPYQEWVIGEKQFGDLTLFLRLDITKDHHLDSRHAQRKANREEALRRKKLGLPMST